MGWSESVVLKSQRDVLADMDMVQCNATLYSPCSMANGHAHAEKVVVEGCCHGELDNIYAVSRVLLPRHCKQHPLHPLQTALQKNRDDLHACACHICVLDAQCVNS